MSNALFAPLTTVANRIGRYWWALLLVGIAWVVIGFVVLRFDSSTVDIISIVFGIVLILSAGGELFRAVITPGGWRVWHVIFAVLLVVGAVIVFINPGATFVSLAIVVGFYFVFAGTYDIVSSLFSVGTTPAWGLQLFAGIIQVLLGFLASSSLSNSVIVLVIYVSVSALFRGVGEIAAAFTVRSLVTK